MSAASQEAKPPRPRPTPAPDPEWEPYWAGAREGRLMVQRCSRCGHHQLYARAHCLKCRGSVQWVQARGTGTVYSYTVIRQNPSRSFRHLIPFVVALVDLDEGPRLMTNIVHSPPESVAVGSAVEVVFEPISEDFSLAFFELVS